jgi:hypothetical protein
LQSTVSGSGLLSSIPFTPSFISSPVIMFSANMSFYGEIAQKNRSRMPLKIVFVSRFDAPYPPKIAHRRPKKSFTHSTGRGNLDL